MARQKGIIKLHGTIGDITFYRTKEGYMAREKGGVSGERIMNDPVFQRTRENGAEFGRAGKAGKVLRNSIQGLIKTTSDSRMVGRLTKEMVQVIHMDTVNPRGLRNVIDGEAELLKGFEFNINGKLSTTLFAPYTCSIDKTSGACSVDIASYIATNSINAPTGSTHYQIVTASMSVDFENESFESVTAESSVLVLEAGTSSALQLQTSLSAGSSHPVFQVLGISFFQEINGVTYLLKNGAYNALQIINVVGV